MSRRTVNERAADLDMVDGLLKRVCASDEETQAVKRVLGVDTEEHRVALAFSPEPPPVPEFVPQIDHLEHARGAVGRYEAWVDSYPDDDPVPLRERQRTLRLARQDLRRLEAKQ